MSTRTAPADPTSVRWLDATQQRAWRAFVVGSTLLMERLDRDLREAFGIALPEYEILVRLSEVPERRLRMSVLADSMCHSRSRITHTVRRLEQRGLVDRVACDLDGRGVEAVMTDAGYDLLVRAAPLHVASVRRHFLDVIDEDDFAATGRAFEAVADGLVTERPDADIR